MASGKLSKPKAGEIARVLATGYLRLLARHGANWREGWELAENEKGKESSEICSHRLDFRANRSIRCAGGRKITITLTRSCK